MSYSDDYFPHEVASEVDQPLRLISSTQLSTDTDQTTGMRRLEALSVRSVGSGALWMGQTHVAPATKSAVHHHGHSETGIYVLSGHPVFIFHDDGRTLRLEASPGDYVYVPPWAPHQELNPHVDEEAVVIIARSTQDAIVVNLPELDRPVLEQP